MRAARAIADVSAGSVHALVEIAVSPERVFRALSSAEILKWWGSADTYRCTRWEGDVRVDGRWRTDGMNNDGTPFWVEGEYLEVDPPKKLVQTWRYGWDPNASVTTLTYLIDAIPGGTRVTIRHTGFGIAHEACLSHGDGWERVLLWLTEYFST